MPEFDITAPSPLMTTLRDLIKGLGGALAALGVVQDSDVKFWSGLILFAAASGYAIYKQVKMRDQATATPDLGAGV